MIEVTYKTTVTQPINLDVLNIAIIKYETEKTNEITYDTVTYVLQMEPLRWQRVEPFAAYMPTFTFPGYIMHNEGHLMFRGTEDDLK